MHASLDQTVAAGNWYEIQLPTSVVSGDGTIDLGLDSLSNDGYSFGSRSSPTPPEHSCW